MLFSKIFTNVGNDELKREKSSNAEMDYLAMGFKVDDNETVLKEEMRGGNDCSSYGNMKIS